MSSGCRAPLFVLVMAKAPVAGRVKTRLCPPCSPAEAAGVAEAALADTLEAVAGCGADRRVLALSGRPGAWLPQGFEVIDQRGSDFGARLTNAWADTGGAGFQIGMDTPQIGVARLDDALGRLDDGAEAILGRALDGGWWGIGFQDAPAGVFDDVEMSCAQTGEQQAARCAELGLDVGDLGELRDVDTWADALIVARETPGSDFARAVGATAARQLESVGR